MLVLLVVYIDAYFLAFCRKIPFPHFPFFNFLALHMKFAHFPHFCHFSIFCVVPPPDPMLFFLAPNPTFFMVVIAPYRIFVWD